MKKKKPVPQKSQETEEPVVKLKPIFGIKPGIYLSVIYGCIIVLILFFLFFFPGIKNNGTYVTFTSAPAGASVYVDGIRKGSSPCTVFVEKGNRNIEFVRPFFASAIETVQIPGRIVFSLFFPVKKTIHVQLSLADSRGFLASAFKDASSWALTGDAHASYRIPLCMSTAVEALYTCKNPVDQKELYVFLYNLLKNINSETMLRDYTKAMSLYAAKGSIISQQSMLDSVLNFIQLKAKYKNLPYLILQSLPRTAAESLQRSSWYIDAAAETRAALGRIQPNSSGHNGSVKIADMEFMLIPGGTFLMGNASGLKDAFPYSETAADMYMARTEVTNAQYARFITENPLWKKSNRASLIEKGLATADYLNEWEADTFPEGRGQYPVTHVSYFAAQAFCSWIGRQLPSGMTEFVARLPREHEWEWAARGGTSSIETSGNFLGTDGAKLKPVASSGANGYGLYDLAGNLWEWCENWYFPCDFFLAPSYKNNEREPTDIDAFEGVEKAVRGGSWANRIQELDLASRASQPPSWCTPFLGFRPVLVQR